MNLPESGVQQVWINGSFVTAKEAPNDVDWCWSLIRVEEKGLDPVLLDFSQGREAMKEKYGVDFFPNVIESVSREVFYRFFQQNRDLEPMGILLVEIRG